jgi:hypothetical protein
MPDEFRENVLREAGEAIGNVVPGRRFFRRRKRFDVQQALARWAARVPVPRIPLTKDASAPPEGEVIDGTCTVIDENEEGAGHE